MPAWPTLCAGVLTWRPFTGRCGEYGDYFVVAGRAAVSIAITLRQPGSVANEQQFRRAVQSGVSGSKASIFVRKTLLVRLRDQKVQRAFLARREGPAFFDEDGVCAGAFNCITARLNCVAGAD